MKIKPSAKCQTPEELAQLRTYVAERVPAIRLQSERFAAAKEVTQRDLRFEVSLVLSAGDL